MCTILACDTEQVTRCVTSIYLDLAWAVTQGSSLAGSEHCDHLIQASLQGTKHLSPSLLFPTPVSRNSHVQRPRPGEKTLVRKGYGSKTTKKCRGILLVVG